MPEDMSGARTGASSRSHLFTVRLWAEELEPGAREYRGEAVHVLTGARAPFRDWLALEEFLVSRIESDVGQRTAPVPGDETGGAP